jgi:hypothetical protein
MKLTVLTITVAFLAVIMISCSNRTNNQTSINQKSDSVASDTGKVIRPDTVLTKLQMSFPKKEGNAPLAKGTILVGMHNFEALSNYIEKNGFVVKQNGIPSDHQVTFVDSKGDRHAFITIRRDANSKPSIKGELVQISVWAYKKGIKDQKHFFMYVITKEMILFTNPNAFDDILFGYKEFLAKAKK